MIELLKMVHGAVSTKDMIPILTHFCIYRDLLQPDMRIQGSNSVVYVDAPFPQDIAECCAPAARFIKAVEACDEKPAFGVTPAGKLSIKNGRFNAYLPILPIESFPRSALDGEPLSLPPGFITTLKRLKPFISLDASRPWSQAVYLSEGYAYATSNVCLMRCPYGWNYRDVKLPVGLIDRLLDIDQEPDKCYLAPNNIAFTYGEAWIRSQLIDLDWPNVANMIPEEAQEPIPDGLFSAVNKIKDFCANDKFPIIRLSEIVQTEEGEHGAAFEGFDLPDARFAADHLLKVLAVATHADFSAYPAPVAVRGDGIEGLIMGLKLA